MSTIKSSAENLTLNADGANNDIIFQSNGTTKVTLDGQNTRLGIGTASPEDTLEVQGTLKVKASLDHTEATYLKFGRQDQGDGNYEHHIKATHGSGTTQNKITFALCNQNATGHANVLTLDGVAGTSTLSGNLVIGTAGKGIDFNTAGTGAGANLLDDYEEGEVTNALDINGTTQTSYSSGRGNLQYTKVGRNVHVQAYLDTQGATLATTGALHIRLPFAVSAGSGTAFVTGVNFMYWSINGVSTPCYTYLNEGDSTISGTNLISEGDGNAITGGSGVSVSGTGHRVIMQYAFTYQTD